MNIVKPYAKMIRLHGRHVEVSDEVRKVHGIWALQDVEYYGRVSHRSEDAQTPDSYERFIRSVVLQHGDWSITEHVNVTVEAVVDRGITHEWVRHRLGAYTQESTRFVNYEKKIPASFVYPKGMHDDTHMYYGEAKEIFDNAIKTSEESYRKLLGCGIPPQIARSVFPNALASKIIVTYNLRSWRHFFLMRTTKEAHPQMREVSIPLLKEFQTLIPILYEDIVPEARQVDNLRMAR